MRNETKQKEEERRVTVSQIGTGRESCKERKTDKREGQTDREKMRGGERVNVK